MSSLAQIQALLEKAEESVRNSSHNIQRPHELIALWMKSMEHFGPMHRSRDPNVVQDAFNDWVSIYTTVLLYLGYVVAAMKMYIRYHTSLTADEDKELELFAYLYQSWVAKAPFLSTHAATAGTLGNMVSMLQPGVKAAHLAGMIASTKLVGTSFFNEGALEEMRDEL